MKNKIIILMVYVSLHCSADETVQAEGFNEKAIPPAISPDDPELKLTPEEQLGLLNAKKADFIVKDIKVGKKKMPSIHKRRLEEIQKEKFDSNPRQTIPLKDCIKPDRVIDNEVNECMNGRLKPYWKKNEE